MNYACGPADWIDLAVGRLEDVKRSLRECDRLRQGCDICEELRQARRCLNRLHIPRSRQARLRRVRVRASRLQLRRGFPAGRVRPYPQVEW